MIATHNIKVNGRWYAAGETIPEDRKEEAKATDLVEMADAIAESMEVPTDVPEEANAEPVKPKRNNTRRKKTSE